MATLMPMYSCRRGPAIPSQRRWQGAKGRLISRFVPVHGSSGPALGPDRRALPLVQRQGAGSESSGLTVRRGAPDCNRFNQAPGQCRKSRRALHRQDGRRSSRMTARFGEYTRLRTAQSYAFGLTCQCTRLGGWQIQCGCGVGGGHHAERASAMLPARQSTLIDDGMTRAPHGVDGWCGRKPISGSSG
jgi:hypothetical protein